MQAVADIKVKKVSKSRVNEVDLEDPGFGRIFSDHMLEMKYADGAWQQPVIKPYGPIEIEPSLSTLHYGQSVFEGTKAYYGDDHTVNLFRPDKNFERMMESFDRLCIPPFEESIFMQGLQQLVQLDHKWVPQKRGNALYIRPFACGWDNIISARVSDTYRFYTITSPVGSYYTDPVKLITSKNYARAVKGGMGEAKTAGNYAGSFYPAQKAKKMGFDQVLWLDAFEHKYIEEVGTMNIFFLIDDVLITPPLGGTILAGITRDSVIHLAKKWGINVEERPLAIDEVMDAADAGTLQEVFGAGTAAVISPVKAIRHHGKMIEMGNKRGELGQKFYDTIYGIQTGQIEDPFGWLRPINTA